MLSVIDRFSKAAHFIALDKLPTATETAKLMVDHVFWLHGIPADITSDRGPQFTSQVWRSFCSAMGAQVNLSSGYTPQTNGQTERLNQELEAALRCVTNHNPAIWAAHLPWVEYAHNSHVSASTGLSPFEASLGYQSPLFPTEEADLAVPSVQHHLQRCRNVWTRTREALKKAAARHRQYADRRRTPAPRYAPEQKVWLAAKDIALKVSSRKLAPRFIRPYTIHSIVSPSAVSNSPYWHLYGSIQFSMFPRFDPPTPVLCAHLPTPLHPPDSSMVTQLIQSGGSLMCASMAEVASSWLTGRATVLRSAHGFLALLFLTTL